MKTSKRGVFFDFYNTLVCFDPPREELHRRACLKFGIDIDIKKIRRAILEADEFYHRESLKYPIRMRPPEERDSFYAKYETILLEGVGVKVSSQLALQIISEVRKNMTRLRVYPDVIPVLSRLKGEGLILGLISNVDRDISGYIEELGLKPFLNVIVTSGGEGVAKPNPEIFRRALSRAGLEASEAIYIGDNYNVDIVGARGSGLLALLIDRYDTFSDRDCPRIFSLEEVFNYLEP